MEAPGFVPNKVYDVHDLDSVNTFNGNLIATVPIGPAFHVNGGLSYGLALHYNSHAWTYWIDLAQELDPQCQINQQYPKWVCYQSYSYPSMRSNAALGWTISLGRLWGPGDPNNSISRYGTFWYSGFTYEDPDGATHTFTFLPGHTVEPVGTILSLDGSYLRFREPDTTHVYIDSRDGVTREFDKVSGTWRLVKISDATGNHVDIAYSPDGYTWTITDVARTITVRFAYGGTYLNTVLQSVTMPSPAGNGANVTYGFSTPSQSMPIPIGVNNPGVISVPVLQTVTPPAGNAYTFTYEGSDNSFSGCLLSMKVPTGATYSWSYLEGGGDVKAGVYSPSVETPVEVTKRVVSDPATDAGLPSPRVWQYDYNTGYSLVCSNTWDPRERITTTLQPDGTRQVHHYNVFHSNKCVTDPLNETWSINDYSLPFTQTTVECAFPWYPHSAGDPACAHSAARTDPALSGAKQYLSTETFDSHGSLVQSHYVTYDGDTVISGGTRPNARVSAEVSYAEDSTLPNIFTATHRYNYRGFGNYATTVGSGAGADGAISSRTTFENYPFFADPTPPALPVFAVDVPSGSCVAGGGFFSGAIDPGLATIPACATISSAFITLFEYDQPHNLLNGKRVLAGSSLGATDLLAHYLHEDAGDAQNLGSNGNVTTEAYEGGDGGAVGTSTSTPFPYSSVSNGSSASNSLTPGFTIIHHKHIYNGAGAVIQLYSYYDRHAFRTSDFTIDAPSGMISSSRDASGRQTNYAFDALGRLSVLTPPGGLITTYTYDESGIPVVVRAVTTRTTGDLGILKQAQYEYDGLGRLWHEKSWVNSGWSTRTTRYDPMSRVMAVSPLQATVSECSDPICTVTSYDGLGRVSKVVDPDGFATTFAYDGGARTTRLQDLDKNTQRTQSKTTENNDGLGRLQSVIDPVNTTGTYTYDAADHLTQAAVSDGIGHTQMRNFTYDNRGFLTSETHPESGQVLYTYDQRGHMMTKILPQASAFDLGFGYDTAERVLSVFCGPTAITNSPTQVMKQFAYDLVETSDGTYNSLTDYTRGKLLTATRHNYQTAGTPPVPVNDTEVSENYHYTDPAGRMTHRQTTICFAPDPSQPQNCTLRQSLTQSTNYNELGLAASTNYPNCDNVSPVACQSLTWDNVSRTYTEGRLTTVQNQKNNVSNTTQTVAAMTYSENEMLSQLSHGTGFSVDTIQPDDQNQMRPKSITVTGQTPGCVAPSWVTPPADQHAQPGTVTFSASAIGTGLTYAWKDGSGNVVSTTQSGSATLNTLGTYSYSLTITACGISVTANFTIYIESAPTCQAPTITSQPVGGTFPLGQVPPPLTVVATPAGNLTYQWWEEDKGGGNSLSPYSTYTPPALQRSIAYFVKVTNTCGGSSASTYSNYAVFNVALTVAPANFVATAGSSGIVTLTWKPLSTVGPGAQPVNHYEVWRTLIGQAGWQIMSPQPSSSDSSWTDSTVSAEWAAAYKMRAVEYSYYIETPFTNYGPFSNTDIATRFTFSALPAAVSAAPLEELRQAINAVRVAAGLPTQTWSQLVTTTPVSGGTITASPILALRAALSAALAVFSIPSPPYIDDGLPAGTRIKRVHITELQGRTQ
jgi:YD repeat-containing protein